MATAAMVLPRDAIADAPAAAMTLGFSTYAMKAMSAADAIKTIAGLGFDSLELCALVGFPTDPAKLEPVARAALRKRIADSGLGLSAIMENLPLQVDDKAHEAGLSRLRAAAEFGHALSPVSPPLIETVLGGSKWPDAKPLFLKRLADWALLAEKQKVVIAIKPHRMNAVSTPAHAMGILHELGNPAGLRMAYDFSHYADRADMPDHSIAGTVRESLPMTAFVAVKDVETVEGKAVFRLPGETGKTDNAAVVKALYAGGYRGDVNCEVSRAIWDKPNFDPIAAATTCYRNMDAAFEKAGVKRK